MTVTKYNKKVNDDGSYRPFFGYTVVADLKDNLPSIEESILKSDVLKKYFSPLPTDSYHMTVFNIWCGSQAPPPVYANILKDTEEEMVQMMIAVERQHEEYDRDAGDDKEAYYDKYPGHRRPPKPIKVEKESFNSVLKLPGGFWFPIMHNVDNICRSDIPLDIKAAVKVRAGCNGVGLGVSLELDKPTSDLFTNTRVKISKEVGHCDSNLMAHMTLAYRYRDIPPEELEIVNSEIQKLNEHISSITSDGITFKPPRACWFRDMTEFLKSEDIFF